MRIFGLLVLSLLFHQTVSADTTVVLQADDFGWYSESGFHNPASSNYIAGYDIGGSFEGEFRNFAVFDLAAVNQQIVAASLVLRNSSTEGYDSPDLEEVYAVFDVNSSINDLMLGNGGVASFDDLGTGTTYGQTTVSAADNASFVTVELNSNAIADLNQSNGLLAFGGAVTSLSGVAIDEQIFARSDLIPDVSLHVKVIPIPEPTMPSAMILFGIGLSRRRRSDHGRSR